MLKERYLTVEEVARRFGVTPTTVYRLARKGRLPAFKIGGQWRFSDEVLSGWENDRTSIQRLKAYDDTLLSNKRQAAA